MGTSLVNYISPHFLTVHICCIFRMQNGQHIFDRHWEQAADSENHLPSGVAL